MVDKTAALPRRTIAVPVTTMEELPVLSKDERSTLLASLEEAEARIASGKFVKYESQTFKDRLLSVYRGGVIAHPLGSGRVVV